MSRDNECERHTQQNDSANDPHPSETLHIWRKLQYQDRYRNHPEFQEIARFVAHWASNRKEVENLSKVPSSVQGNIAYILQVIKHHNIIDNDTDR